MIRTNFLTMSHRTWVQALFLFAAALGPALAGDTLNQISTITALMKGVYDGPVTIGQLSRLGDFGLGTFNCLDGEMIVVEGTCFQVTGRGKVRRVGASGRTPFAAVTYFFPERTRTVRNVKSFETFQRRIDALLPSANLFYAVRVRGRFSRMVARSVPAQRKPYRPLAEVVKEQSVFRFRNIEGTLVGFRCPAFSKEFNVAGWHLHFISASRTEGGHVLDFACSEAEVSWDVLPNFKVYLPGAPAFLKADLTAQGDVKAVETLPVPKSR